MHIWIIKRPNILAYLGDTGVALGMCGGNHCRVISKGNISSSWGCVAIPVLTKFLFNKTKVKQSTNKNQTRKCLPSLLRAAVLFFHRLFDGLVLNRHTLTSTSSL